MAKETDHQIVEMDLQPDLAYDREAAPESGLLDQRRKISNARGLLLSMKLNCRSPPLAVIKEFASHKRTMRRISVVTIRQPRMISSHVGNAACVHG
jgi:hypothetical protein